MRSQSAISIPLIAALMTDPPGNRDPLPEEIEACESHIFRQIELIAPRVVATLGNFATKLLSGKPLGITRVHGQEQALSIAGRSVLLYPLYHPAAALYTPAMLKVLEADFARLPELMGSGAKPAAVAARPTSTASAARSRWAAPRCRWAALHLAATLRRRIALCQVNGRASAGKGSCSLPSRQPDEPG